MTSTHRSPSSPSQSYMQRNWSLEYTKLKAKVDILQKNQRHFRGEEIENLGLKELENLEQQLDTALKLITAKKNQLLFESISEYQNKEKALNEQNNQLEKQLKEKETKLAKRAQWEQPANQGQTSQSFTPQSHPSLNISVLTENSAELRLDRSLIRKANISSRRADDGITILENVSWNLVTAILSGYLDEVVVLENVSLNSITDL